MRAKPPNSARTPRAHRTDRTAYWARYQDNTARHLIGISRDLQTRMMERLGADFGYADLRASFGAVVSLVATEERSLTELAEQLAISKQACNQLVNLAEGCGYIERRADPHDGRAKRLALAAKGHSLVEHGVETLIACEAVYAELVGSDAYRSFVDSLATIYHGLGIPTHADPGLARQASSTIGVLPLIAVRLQQDLMNATSAAGHRGLKMSHGEVLPLIGPHGARVHELARIQQVSRQAISATARDLEALGYLQREPDPRDRRGSVLQLTRLGRRLIADSVAALDVVDAQFRSLVGDRDFEGLASTARALFEALHLEEEIFGPRIEAPAVAREPVAQPTAAHSTKQDLHELAASLRRQLGSRDAARLAALLDPAEKRTER